MLHYFASHATGAIVEIGPYIGGSTVAIANGRAQSVNRAPIITIEVGGAHEHFCLPSDDILRDLRATLREYGFEKDVAIVQGWSNAPATVEEVKRILGQQRIGMFVMDGDGQVAINFDIYRPMLAAGAIIVFDDYTCACESDAELKQAPVREAVENLVRSGVVRDLGVYKWGTWFGEYVGG